MHKIGGRFSGVIELALVLLVALLVRTFGYGLYRVPTGSMETTMLAGELFFADKFTPLFLPFNHGDIVSFNDPQFNYSENYFIKIIQNYWWGPINWSKRIIGLPGDHLQGKVESGKAIVYRNGKKLFEPYVNTNPLVAVWQSGEQSAGNEKVGSWVFRSYDPSYNFKTQPWYYIDSKSIKRDIQGDIVFKKINAQHLESDASKPSQKNHWDGTNFFDVTLKEDEYWLMGDNRLNSYDSRFLGPIKKKFIHGKMIYRLFSVDNDVSLVLLEVVKKPLQFWKKVRWARNMQALS